MICLLKCLLVLINAFKIMSKHLIMAYNYFHKVVSAYSFSVLITIALFELFAPAILNQFNVILLN